MKKVGTLVLTSHIWNDPDPDDDSFLSVSLTMYSSSAYYRLPWVCVWEHSIEMENFLALLELTGRYRQ